MKGLLLVLVLTITAGPVLILGDETSPASEPQEKPSTLTPSPNCDDEKIVHPHHQPNSFFNCVYSIAKLYLKHMPYAVTTGEKRLTTKLFCDVKPISLCLAQVKSHSERCHPGTMNNTLTAAIDNLQSAMDVVCREDGERFADLQADFSRLSSEDNRLLFSCAEPSLPAKGMETPLEEMLRLAYVAIVQSKPCLLEKGTGVVETIDYFVAMLGEIASQMKCIHPEEKTVILCSSVY